MAGSGEARKVPPGLASAHEARTLVVLVGVAVSATPAAAQSLDQLGARLNALESQLKKTRTTVRRQAVRLARLQRRLDQQGGSGRPASRAPTGASRSD